MKTAVILLVAFGVSWSCANADHNQRSVSYFNLLETFRSHAHLWSKLDARTMKEVFQTVGEVAGALDIHDVVEVLARSQNEGEKQKARYSLQVASSILETADSPSAACLNDTNEVIQNLLNTQLWAMQSEYSRFSFPFVCFFLHHGEG